MRNEKGTSYAAFDMPSNSLFDMHSASRTPRSALIRLGADLAACEHMAILGEGNVSARLDDERFVVKASGTRLGALRPEHLVEVRTAPLVAALEGDAAPVGYAFGRM